MKKQITNTTREAAERPGLTMLEMMLGKGPTGAIERSEARGQRELVSAAVLPTNGLGLQYQPQRAVWEAMGIKLGDQVAGDEMFTNVTLPAGWAKRATDHSMWSDLVDNKGRVRARIFYKAAFYDRSARITPVTRFTVARDFDRKDYNEVIQVRVLDSGKVVFVSAEHRIAKVNGKQDWDAQDCAERKAEAECFAWLSDNGYPDYKNPAAYWD